MKTWKTFAIWTLFAETILSIFLFFFGSLSKVAVYGTNDDALISSISNGQLTGNPNGYLIFLNPLISFPLSWIQNFVQNLNIYIYFLTFVVTLSFAMILGLLQFLIKNSKQRRIIAFILWILSSCTFVSWFSISPTYTGASIFAAGASVCFAYIYLSNKLQNHQDKYVLLISFIILFFLSTAIRRESMFIFIFFITVLLVPEFSLTKLSIKKILIIFFTSLILILTNLITEKIVYEQDEWKKFYETNQLRHKIQLREPERRLETAYPEIGWDKNTFELFSRFILVDESKMNSENLANALQVTKENQLSKYIKNFSTTKIIENTKLAFAPWTWLIMLLALIVGVNLFNIHQRKEIWKYVSKLTLFAITVPLLFLYLSSSYHLPERISVNFLGGLSLIILTISFQFSDIRRVNKKIFLISQIILTLLGIIFYMQRFQIELKARQDLYLTWRSVGDQQRASLSALPLEVKVIGSASSIKSDWQNPYIRFKSLDSRNSTFVLGWHNLSPVWYEGVNKLKLDSNDFYLNLIKNNVYWASSRDDFTTMKNYLEFHLDKNISIEDLGSIGYEQYHYYKLTVQP
ncbi:MAG: hypothetical protein RI943_1515 [Bacteroidota bacterium]|jgi:hypothetical protein